MNIYTPYTYLIGWSHLNTYYYGVRFAKGCHPNDLWVTYFTSSKFVDEFRKEHGEPNIIEVRKTFNDALSAKKWESNVLVRLECATDPKWLNKHDASSEFINLQHSEETKLKISCTRKKLKIEPWNKGKTNVYSEATLIQLRKPKTPEHIENIKSNHVGTTGYRHTEETKQKMKKRIPWNKGISHTEETKRKISRKKVGKSDAGMKGKCHSEESKEKQRLARKLWWENKKQNDLLSF